MRYRWILIILGIALMAGCKSSVPSQTPSSEDLSTISGRYVYIPNPCTTKPCLPGMAYAVQVNDLYYYITVGNQWIPENSSWGEYTPQIDDLVTVTGYLEEKQDVDKTPFFTIDVVSLHPTK